MSIESIIIVFSLALLGCLIFFFVAVLIYSKINKVEQEDIITTPLQQKKFNHQSATQVGFIKYASPSCLTKFPDVYPSRRQNLSSGNYNFNGHTQSAHRSLYTVFNSTQKI